MLRKKFQKDALAALATITALSFSSSALAAIAYSQDFEGMNPADPNALSADGWKVGGIVRDPNGGFIGQYFAYPAPNGGPAFSGVATGEGGPDQGNNQMSVYNDYNNGEHNNGNLVQAFVFNETVIGADDANTTVGFGFDTKTGNLVAPTTANAYITVLKTSDGSFATLFTDALDTTNLGGGAWTSGGLSALIDPSWVGETFQFGFTSTATNFDGSGRFYDNINVGAAPAVPVPAAVWLFGSGLLGLVGVARRKKAGV